MAGEAGTKSQRCDRARLAEHLAQYRQVGCRLETETRGSQTRRRSRAPNSIAWLINSTLTPCANQR
jgi:hypothetical protein